MIIVNLILYLVDHYSHDVCHVPCVITQERQIFLFSEQDPVVFVQKVVMLVQQAVKLLNLQNGQLINFEASDNQKIGEKLCKIWDDLLSTSC